MVAEVGSVTAAARRLHLTQPAVSTQLRKLEDDMGLPLFHRSSSGMLLTEAGRVLLGHVEAGLGALDAGRAALRQLAGLERGTLSIGGGATATTYLLPGLLRSFHERYPAIRIHLREQGSRRVVDGVLSGDLDLGVVTLPIDLPRDAPVEVKPWIDDELRLLLPPGHRLEGRGAFRWAELAGESLVLFEAGSAVRRHIDDAIADSGVEVDIVMELRSIESIKQMVAQGIGAGFVSRYALAASQSGLACRDGTLARQLAVVSRSDRAPSRASQAFREMM